MATGVLPLLLGKYTRLAQFYGQADKTYTGTIRFGLATDTYDAEGEPAAEEKPLQLSLEALQKLASRFHGEMEQVPPPYSAKKIEGVPAYKLARAGKQVPVRPAKIVVRHFALLSLVDDAAAFEMKVSAGGYVRAVAHELGQMAGCGAHLASLRRTCAGAFTLEQAISVEAMQQLGAAGELEAHLPHPRTLLPDMPGVTVDVQTAGHIRNGMAMNLPEFSNAPLVKIFSGQRELLAIGKRIAGTLIQPMIVMG
jgi:tRNA pseudouridine55 synthase